ncbi:hypothetical protein BGZ96_007400 [Linnemannia gamsii]|uniref:Uncharacterized protein n=1 Tax=Linnemannia gamsii TaxID=64522 RepID=A0ABQ7KF05_9FUNG|nr:hypothetical protein BGZ96_007400 [Linnemannia gamsii]
MDVVRITQALRQQQQNPGRLNPSRTGGGGSSLIASPSAGSSSGETLHINTAHASIDNGSGVQTTPCASPTPSSAGGNGGSAGGPISPSSSFFSSLAHLLPGSAAATVAGAAGSSSVGEIESLLLRSMPMFGNLVSRD